MTDADQTAETDLVGVRGWLLFYVVVTILGVLASLFDPTIWSGLAGPVERYFRGLIMTIELIGLYLIFRVRKPTTQTYHIWLNFILAGYVAFFAVESGEPEGWVSVVILLIWAVYWIRSKRVRATYCEDAVGIRSEPVSSHSVEEPPAQLTEDDLRAYVGDEADYYLNKWRPMLNSGRGFVGFNWPGCLFSGLWFLYRKMYWTGAIVFVLLGVISTAGFLVLVPLWILCGFLANRFYYEKAKRIITKVRVDHPTASARVAVLATKGGTNGTLIVVLVVIQVALMVLDSFLTGGELP